MPKFLFLIKAIEVPLIDNIAENTHGDLRKITPKQLAGDLKRLEPPSKIIIDETDQLCMMRELAKTFDGQPQQLLGEVMEHIKEKGCNIRDNNLKLALLNITQAGIPFIITKELRANFLASYGKNQNLDLVSLTPRCNVYAIQPTHTLATITEIHLLLVDALGPVPIPGFFSCAIKIPFNGNGNGLGLFHKNAMPSISFEFEDHTFLADFIMSPRVIAKIQENPDLLFDYYRACNGNHACLATFIAAMEWPSNSLQQVILNCKRSADSEHLPDFVQGIIERFPAAEQLTPEQIRAIYALLEICAQNPAATARILAAFPFGHALPLSTSQFCQLWALNSTALNANIIAQTDIPRLFNTALIGTNLPYDPIQCLRNLLRNPTIQEAIPNLRTHIPALVETGIITPHLLGVPECRYLIGLCAEIAPRIFASYQNELSDEAFIHDIIDNKIGIDPRKPEGLLAILRVHSIMFANPEKLADPSSSEKIRDILSLPNSDPEIRIYCTHILNAYRPQPRLELSSTI